MEDEEDNFCKYGTPLKPFEEDQIPSKRPIAIEDQIVRDANGKRRFHGAFTGGFAAGYWNTVGSEEGWKPKQFKSSRNEKGTFESQNAMDFMDDEDLGEFGIAPQKIQTQNDFGDSRVGKKADDRRFKGPIPGVPVLQTLLAPVHEKAAIRILKSMGWKQGQGVGARLTKREKKRAAERNEKEKYLMKMYGCELGPREEEGGEQSDEESSDSSDYEITFAPDDFESFVVTPKDNSFGLGYSGLNKEPILNQNLRVFDTLEVVDRKTNKKLSIRGQAFGVGALEEDDDDIYERDDMTRYDFAIEGPKPIKAPTKHALAIKSVEDSTILEGFCKSKNQKTLFQTKKFTVELPQNFKPRNWFVKRSRFDQIRPEVAQKINEDTKHLKMGLGRHDLNPEERGKLINESVKPSTSKIEEVSVEPKREIQNVSKDLIQKAQEITKNLPKSDGVFRPFALDPDKQERYEKFLDFNETNAGKIEEFLTKLQPLGMSDWDKEREMKEFIHAKKLYKPLSGLMNDRFVSAGSNSHTDLKIIEDKKEVPIIKEIKMKRTKSMWKPHKDLCKRFNVPEPFGGMMIEEKPQKKNKFSVFDYIELPTNSRTNFVTPVINPKRKRVEEPSITAKEFFNEKLNLPKPLTTSKSEEKKPSIATIIPRINEPKTELEKKVEESLTKPPQEKKDLFKSIFCDSDDSDEENEEPKSTAGPSEQDKLKLVESFVATKPASEINILRNKSPPRGIFRNVFEITQALPTTSTKFREENDEKEELYGPKLPEVKIVSSNLDRKLEKLLKKTSKSKEIIEKWVEKDKLESKKKKKKKHKEHKSKHKKKKKDHKKK